MTSNLVWWDRMMDKPMAAKRGKSSVLFFLSLSRAAFWVSADMGLLLAFPLRTGAEETCRRPTHHGRTKDRPKLRLSLPDHCNTLDRMRLDPKTSDVILSCSNFADANYPGKLMKITPDNRLEVYFDRLPPHPVTGKVVPMGLDFGLDGNLDGADNQYFSDKNYQSRLLRVNIRDGKPVSAEVLVEGFKLANAVRWGVGRYLSATPSSSCPTNRALAASIGFPWKN